jgi:hypothetical protein
MWPICVQCRPVTADHRRNGLTICAAWVLDDGNADFRAALEGITLELKDWFAAQCDKDSGTFAIGSDPHFIGVMSLVGTFRTCGDVRFQSAMRRIA